MAIVYLLALAVAAVGWVAERRRAGPAGFFAPACIGLLISYALAMTGLCLDPYYDDNGLPEFIDRPHRWMWAAEFAFWLSFVTVPAALACAAFARAQRAKG